MFDVNYNEMSEWEENEVFIPRANEIYDKQAEFTKRSLTDATS